MSEAMVMATNGNAASVSTGKRRILNLVEENLRNELSRRRGRKAHAQLGVDSRATTMQIEAGYARLVKEYQPQAFALYGFEATDLARQIVEMLSTARDQLLLEAQQQPLNPVCSRLWIERPESESTLRALETVRGAIARHRSEAFHHREAGRLPQAIASLEALLRLDRHDSFARKELPRLLRAVEPRSWWQRALAWCKWWS